MPHISYVDPATVEDPERLAIVERARILGTPRPESQAIRLHHPEVMKALNHAWEVAQEEGVGEGKVAEILTFETSGAFDAREKAALEWAMAITWDPALADTVAGLAPAEAARVREQKATVV